MVREEYLNPEFMYKLINSLCKADGWTMYFLVFGKLTYRNFKQPILMQKTICVRWKLIRITFLILIAFCII